MTPGEFVSSLTKRNILITYGANGSLKYWPTQLISPDDLEAIRGQRDGIIAYLKGLTVYFKGTQITTPNGNGVIYETFMDSEKVAVTGNEKFPFTFKIDECATMVSYIHLKERFRFIESYIYRQPKSQWPKLFKAFEDEWRWLFQELNRQQFLIEAWCGPMIQNTVYQTYGVDYARA
jgi:hypothetical protein